MLGPALDKARIRFERLRVGRRRQEFKDAEARHPGPKQGSVRVAALHYWDTRAKFRDVWPLNTGLVEHNFRLLEDGAPVGQTVDHFVILHEVSDVPAVEAFLPTLSKGRNLEVVRVQMDLTPYKHPHKMTFVARHSFDVLGARLADYDYVFMLPQDTLLVDHFEANFLELLIGISRGRPSREAKELLHPDRPGAEYVSHTIGTNPNWNLFTHNAAFGRGLFPASKIPRMRWVADRAGDWIPAERYLGEVVDEACHYLRPHDRFYHGDYPMEDLTPQRAQELLRLAESPKGAVKVREAASRQWAGGLRAPWTEIA